jgi:hypothetical protein
MRRRLLSAAVIAATLLGAGAVAEPRATIPANVQIALLTKIWSFDRGLSRPGTVTVGIVYQRLHRQSFVEKEEIVKAGSAQPGIRFVAIDLDAAEDGNRFQGLDVVYFTRLRAVELSEMLVETRRRRIRTVTAVPEYVPAGVGVGIAVERDRPQILINREACRAEGADFSSQLLKLAKVIQ